MKQEFWLKSQENLADAEEAFQKERFNASANRAYYAAFQAAVSALARENITVEKIGHEWVQSAFNRELIHRRKLYSSSLRSLLLEMQEVRNIADYASNSVKKSDAKRQLEKAKSFIQSIQYRIKI